MKVGFIGAGAVGCYFGGKLAQAHFDVTFIARGETYAALKSKGLQVLSARGDIQISQVNVIEENQIKEKMDIIFITTKAWHIDESIVIAKKLAHAETKVFSLQCGIEKDEKLIRAFGVERVGGALSEIDVFKESPAVVRHLGTSQKLILGDFQNPTSPQVRWLEKNCESARIEIEVAENIAERIWENFVYKAALSGVTTFLKLSIGPIRRNPANRDLLHSALMEGCALSKAAQYPVRMQSADYLMERFDKLPAFSTSVMYKSLQNGQPLELDCLSGEIIKLGKKYNVPTPVHQKIYDALLPFKNGKK